MYGSIRVPPVPDWAKHLLIYEIPTRSATSPNGAGSGTFLSTADLAPYLADLGINGIWLAGHSLSDDTHFYNTWTQYACIDPTQLDPRLGSEADFGALVEQFHFHGIRVFLDVITHGVMSDSPLVANHPDWFSGGSWGMCDFAWHKRDGELDRWWVETWTRYVREFGVDGYRLDVATFRPDLWAAIKSQCRRCGHEIAVFSENGPGFPGAVDFLQRGIELTEQTTGIRWKSGFLRNPIAALSARASSQLNVTVELGGQDRNTLHFQQMHPIESRSISLYNKPEQDDGSVAGSQPSSRSYVGGLTVTLSTTLPVETVNGSKPLENIRVYDDLGTEWALQGKIQRDYRVNYTYDEYGAHVSVPVREPQGLLASVQISSHDDGWEGFEGSNPYAARGSRFLFGYAGVLLPAITLFMAGEEFGATYRPLPSLTPDLFGSGEPGTGRWLYGSWLDWNELTQQHHRSIHRDFRRLISIRNRFNDVIRANESGAALTAKVLPFETDSDYAERAVDVSQPYCYQNDTHFIVVAGNRSSRTSVKLTVTLPDVLGNRSEYMDNVLSATTLFGGGRGEEEPFLREPDSCGRIEIEIPPDHVPDGGVKVVAIEKRTIGSSL